MRLFETMLSFQAHMQMFGLIISDYTVPSVHINMTEIVCKISAYTFFKNFTEMTPNLM